MVNKTVWGSIHTVSPVSNVIMFFYFHSQLRRETLFHTCFFRIRNCKQDDTFPTRMGKCISYSGSSISLWMSVRSSWKTLWVSQVGLMWVFPGNIYTKAQLNLSNGQTLRQFRSSIESWNDIFHSLCYIQWKWYKSSFSYIQWKEYCEFIRWWKPNGLGI